MFVGPLHSIQNLKTLLDETEVVNDSNVTFELEIKVFTTEDNNYELHAKGNIIKTGKLNNTKCIRQRQSI